MKRLTIFFCMIATAFAGEADFAKTPEATPYRGQGVLSHFVKNYLPQYEQPVSFANSNRMDALMRAGNIYLSLQDAIALALENSLDIEYHRYSDRRQAETDLMRA